MTDVNDLVVAVAALTDAITATCQQLDDHLAQQPTPSPTIDSAGAVDLTGLRVELQTHIVCASAAKTLADVATTMRARLVDAMGDADTGLIDGHESVTYRRNAKTKTFDKKAFERAHPELAAEFTVLRDGNRVFKVLSS